MPACRRRKPKTRLAELGPNELRERPPTPFWKLVLAQLNNFVVILLVVAAVISALLGDVIEAVVIMAIVVLNAVLGVVQESRAEKALAALKKMAAPEAETIRDGHRVRVSSRELVPGDVVLIEAGNYVPADLRLIESVNLKIDEASLTGESVAVEKQATDTLKPDVPLSDRRNAAYMSTLVTYGRGKGIVIGTGMNTQMGMIATMLQSVEEEQTPLQKKLDQLGKTLGIARADHLRPGVWRLRAARARQPDRRSRHGGRRCLLDLGQPRHCRRAGRSARHRHDHARHRHARDDQAPRVDPQTRRGGNARLGHDDLLGQDRHADAKRNDGREVVGASHRGRCFRAGLSTRRAFHARNDHELEVLSDVEVAGLLWAASLVNDARWKKRARSETRPPIGWWAIPPKAR